MAEKMKKSVFLRALAVLCCTVLVCLLPAAVLIWNGCQVSFILPDGSVVSQRVPQGFSPARIPQPEAEGWTFIGWEDETGALIPTGHVRCLQDQVFTARMMPRLITQEHLPYLSADDRGFLRPDEAMTRAEAAQALYLLLPDVVQTQGNFKDVPAAADYARAAALLKTLRLVEGDFLYPEEAVTVRELLSWLDKLFPTPEEPVLPFGRVKMIRFADVDSSDPSYDCFVAAARRGWIDSGADIPLAPDSPLTRSRAAALLNRVLERGRDLTVDASQAGAAPDLHPSHPLYAQMLEAVVPHQAKLKRDTEVWESSEPMVRVPEGLLFTGGQLYCIDAEGYLIRNGSRGNFFFDEDGLYTSGLSELDELIRQVLSEVTDESMTDAEKLKAAYDYCVHSFRYLRRNFLEPGETGWGEQVAYVMLTSGKGDCYSFAAVFYELARALGYDARLLSALLSTPDEAVVPHGFVVLESGGKPYIFDPELEWAFRFDMDREDSWFMLPENHPLLEEYPHYY